MIRDTMQFLGDERFVGRKLEDLLYSPEVNAERVKFPDPETLNLVPEITSDWIW